MDLRRFSHYIAGLFFPWSRNSGCHVSPIGENHAQTILYANANVNETFYPHTSPPYLDLPSCQFKLLAMKYPIYHVNDY